MKIKVMPEGRDGIYIPVKVSLLDWVKENCGETIHCFIPSQIGVIGADWRKEDVLEEIDKSERLGILAGDAFGNNLKHALSVIVKTDRGEELRMFDIGDVEEDLEIDATVMDQ